MTWTRLSDDYSDDCWQLSDAAWRLHTEGLIWSNRKLLNLRLAKDELRLWAKRPEAAAELVDTGWWTDDGEHYVIRHHGCYQRDREAVLRQQEANRQNGRRGGRPPGPARELPAEASPEQPSPETDSLTDSLTDSKSERDGTGLVWRSLEKEPNYVSGNGEKKQSEDDYFAAIVASEPATDPDGFPLDERGGR